MEEPVVDPVTLDDVRVVAENMAETFTAEEVHAARETKRILKSRRLGDEERLVPLSDREIMLVTITSKLRPDTAANKYCKWLEAMSAFGIQNFDEVFADLDKDETWATLEQYLNVYAPCGKDKFGRSVMWIRSRPVQPEYESTAVRCSCLYYVANHADWVSLRTGVLLVLDTANNDMTGRVGNEGKLQRVWQSIPLRPQKIFILGAGVVKRVLINAILTIASYFTSEKVMGRIRFAELEDIKEDVAEEDIPEYAGGGAGGFKDEAEHAQWIRNRIASFPAVPDLN